MKNYEYSQLRIKDHRPRFPGVQGGMGIGVSLKKLAAAVGQNGWMGTISSAAIDVIGSNESGRKLGTYEAVYREISLAKEMAPNGLIGINIMVYLQRDYRAAVQGALDAKADFIISGAGLPFELPTIQAAGPTARIPIVSSARALNVLLNRWEKNGHRPDAIVLEGPLAGGHLGFKITDIDNPEFQLEKLLPPIKEMAIQHGDFPVIVAGGIYTNADVRYFLERGADGVQIGTRFMVATESSASLEAKQAVLRAEKEDILVCPHSPCGLPFRIIKQSPVYQELLRKKTNKCDRGYLLQKKQKRPDRLLPSPTRRFQLFLYL